MKNVTLSTKNLKKHRHFSEEGRSICESIYLSYISVGTELLKSLRPTFAVLCSCSCPLFRQGPGSSCTMRGNLVGVVCINASVFETFVLTETLSFKNDLTLPMEQTH